MVGHIIKMSEKESSEAVLPIGRFSLSSIKKDSLICVIAKRGSGKSWVCRSIVKYLLNTHVAAGLIISRTERLNPFYKRFFPSLCIHYEYSPRIMKRLFERQLMMLEKRKKKISEGKKVNPRVVVVMDDCLASKKLWVNDEYIRQVFLNGRHYKVTYIITMQYPLGVPPELRINFDYIFILADDSYTNRKRIYVNYGNVIETFKVFCKVYAELTKDYGCMVVSNVGGSCGRWTDKVFYYKSDPPTTEREIFGSRRFVKFSARNINKNWSKPKEKVAKIGEIGDSTGFKVKIR